MKIVHSIYNDGLFRLIIITSLVCGLEFCTSAAFSYIPPLLLKAGVSDSLTTWLMGCGPLMGFILCPVVGHASDRCRSRFGRRRPFILGFCITIIFCLILMPQSESIGQLLDSPKLGLILLIITCVLFDFASQACFNPCESLIYDTCKSTPQEASCFFVYSFMTSFGGCLGYLITAYDWSQSWLAYYIHGQEKITFIVILTFFTLTLCCTLMTANEKSFTDATIDEQLLIGNEQQHLTSTSSLDMTIWCKNIDFLLFKVIIRIVNVFVQLIIYLILTIVSSIRTIITMPFVLRRLALADCLSWSAIMTFNLFFTDYVGQTVYGGDPSSPEFSDERQLYDAGVRAGSFGLLFHCIVGAVYAPILKPLIYYFGIRLTFSFGMFVFVISMFVMYMSRNIIIVNAMASLSGLGMASLTSIPYTLVMLYHSNREVFFADSITIQNRGIGTVLGIIDSTYFASQIISSVLMGYIMLIFKSTLSYIVTSFFLGIFSIYFINRIVIKPPSGTKNLISPIYIRS
ncbi:unnamed protein product [Didymodactylos carnosus]|uniref:Membrane-associated transporter protein n=1 Tax=Didymodactylos carnosus TaxID=1234261 RepID=A0A813P6L5_9BILA|nr:unnamed protein product [Didymodactylos carnosus]CAF0748955.1 unnamed protein product [Didymodactylos carnosus]CAF3526539.1 unnamed protein product [Didymodactylos carnosus]CAF3528181.1 unnamed protein product [Didymodactylos carnosus]